MAMLPPDRSAWHGCQQHASLYRPLQLLNGTPFGPFLQVFDIALGQQITLLSQGHYDTVTACVYSPLTNQLYSCGIDGALLAWEPWNDEVVANPQQQQYYGMDYWLAAAAGRRVAQLAQSDTAAPAVSVAADVDAWSEDDEYELN